MGRFALLSNKTVGIRLRVSDCDVAQTDLNPHCTHMATYPLYRILIGFWVTVKLRPQLVPISVSFTRDRDIAYDTWRYSDRIAVQY